MPSNIEGQVLSKEDVKAAKKLAKKLAKQQALESNEESKKMLKKDKKLKKEKKEKKKRKRDEEDADDKTDTSSTIAIEDTSDMDLNELKRKKQKKNQQETEISSSITLNGAANPPLSKFRICEETQKNLHKRGITTLFPIQAMTFDNILNGRDLMGRARTGMGKTLAFALPVIEKLLMDTSSRTKARGRAPRVICMAPTRELAKQVATEFEETAPSLKTVTIYGGTSYNVQNNAFRDGVDILVGTTGRVIDHIDRGNLRLHNCQFLILDEADTMLEMGFREDVQKVCEALEQQAKQAGENGVRRQTLLFSATIGKWVSEVADKYMAKDRDYINLVDDNDVKASKDVQHIAIPCHWQGRPTLLAQLLGVYAPGKDSRTIIFAETKRECNELAVHPEIKTDARVLHGDIAQDQRETTMKAFRDGKLRLLIATDVAARGLDMNVDLVINSEPPRRPMGGADVDTYVHRSGRTGRAGRKGTCITLYTNKQLDAIEFIEKKIGNKFIMKSAPTQADLIKSTAAHATSELENVHGDMLEMFQDQAETLINDMGATNALAAALACLTGNAQPPRQVSALSGMPDYQPILFSSSNVIRAKGYVWNAINNAVPEDVSKDIKQLTLLADSMGAVFDVPVASLDTFKQLISSNSGSQFSIPKELPPLQQQPRPTFSNSRGSGGGYGGRGGGYGSRGGGFSNNRGGGRGGRGGRGFRRN